MRTMDHITPEQRALRALRDCGVIRVRLGHVPPPYIALQRSKAVTAKRIGDHFANVKLSDYGQTLAKALPRFPGDRR